MSKAFIIHKFPFQDADYIAKVFTESHGLISILAKGAKRSKKGVAGLLQPFLPVEVEWVGKSDLKKLRNIELSGGAVTLAGIRLYSAFYLNELMLYLCPMGVPQETIFQLYEASIHALAENELDLEPILRTFEWYFLEALGVGPNLTQDAGGKPIDPDAFYVLQVESMPMRAESSVKGCFKGEELIGIQQLSWADKPTLKASKRLLRYWISHYCNGKTFKSREMCATYSNVT